MKITSIQFAASRTFNHPYESYANFRFEISQVAQLEEGEDPAACLTTLQEQTEARAEAHKKRILDDIERKRLILQGEQELARLKARQKQTDETPAEIERVEESLRRLTETPLLLGDKVIHAGHADHPETDDYTSQD